jgi:uncharacterized integral membrane protein (TIGR00698 family)
MTAPPETADAPPVGPRSRAEIPAGSRAARTPRGLLALLPGLGLALLVALAARGIHEALPAAYGKVLGEVIFAVTLGFLAGNLAPIPQVFLPGIRFSFKTVLRTAIVLLGAGFSFGQILAIGGKALGMIVALMAAALAVAHFFGRRMSVPAKLATLIGVGTAVCGNSAISAAAPVIGARDEDVSFAIATNTLLGTVAVLLYPALAHAAGMSDAHFGTWAGLAVNDTSQVVAAGFAVSDAAGRVATAVKLTRNALMGPVILLLGLAHTRAAAPGGAPAALGSRLRQSVPLFVVGFLALALFNTLGGIAALGRGLGTDVAGHIAWLARFLILVALAGVGLGTSGRALRKAGVRPLWLGILTAATTSLAALVLIRLFGPASG